MGLLTGKVALVTGAGSENGIGFGACLSLAKAGAKVVITDLVRSTADQQRLDTRVADIVTMGGDAISCALDVTDRQQAEDAIEACVEHFGRLDIVFNNAGFPGGVGPFLEQTDEQYNISWQVNLMGIVNVCRSAIPVMQAQGGGSIVNNSSLAGIGVIAGLSGYSASKFAVVGLTKVMAAEFGGNNIRVNAVCPGMVWTDMGKAEVEFLREPGQSFEDAKSLAVQEVPLQKRWASAQEIGDAVVYLGSNLSTYVTGVALPVAGGLAPGL